MADNLLLDRNGNRMNTMKRFFIAFGAIAFANVATMLGASADTYVVVPYAGYDRVLSTGPYDQNFALNPVPIITDPSGEGGGVQSPGSGSVPAQ
jgi:hypothetical protein